MTSLPPFDYERPADLATALAALGASQSAGRALPVHGGTELLPAMGLGLLAPQKLVSVRAVPELRVLRRDGGRLVVGAGLTHREIAASAVVRQAAPLLAEVAGGVGNVRVRSTGTLGGNLAFAEPRSDLTTALLALAADVRLDSAAGQRQVPLASFLLGPYEVDLRPGELITAIALDDQGAGFSAYRKIVFSERPVVGVALTHLTASGQWRIVVGAVGLTPLITDASALADLEPARIAAAADIVGDLAGSEDYKRHLAAVAVQRCRAAAMAFERERTAS